MLTDMELYGKVMTPVPEEVCDERINTLKERLEKLMSVHYMSRDNSTVNIVVKGIEFWTKLKNGEENEIYS